MKILILCAEEFNFHVEKTQSDLEALGHQVYLPNQIKAKNTENYYERLGVGAYRSFRQILFEVCSETIQAVDAILVLNYTKNDSLTVTNGYVDGTIFLEMYEAFMHNKKIFMVNSVYSSVIEREIMMFNPTFIEGDLRSIK